MDTSGALYGATYSGGVNGGGTVFKLTPPTSGGNWTETTLYNFTGGNDGGFLSSSLLFDASGALYGTTEYAGSSGYGSIFKLTPPTTTGGRWTETVLHTFGGFNASDGAYPAAGLIADASGALYGTTYSGGASNDGTIFQLTVPAVFTGIPG
jgi:uncharacterized repeat protein (TIGR03803 family)